MSLNINTNKSWELGVLLIPGYNLAEMSHIIEPLKVANHSLGHTLYEWKLFSLEGPRIEVTKKNCIKEQLIRGSTYVS